MVAVQMSQLWKQSITFVDIKRIKKCIAQIMEVVLTAADVNAISHEFLFTSISLEDQNTMIKNYDL
jgi:hypothetical protein